MIINTENMEQTVKVALPDGGKYDLRVEGNLLRIGNMETALDLAKLWNWVNITEPQDYGRAVQDLLISYNTLLAEYVEQMDEVTLTADSLPRPETFRRISSLCDFLTTVGQPVR